MGRDHSSQTAPPAGAQFRSNARAPKRILVVDDDFVIRRFSSLVLARSGYQVDTAEDGESGWESLHAKKYDLLITDNNMPKVTGLELLTKLRAEDTTLPVILVSGRLPTEELNQCPWLNLAATLSKPFTFDELLGKVHEILHPTSANGAQRDPLPRRSSQPAAEVA